MTASRDLFTVSLTDAQVSRAIEEYVLRGQNNPTLAAKVDATELPERVLVTVSTKRVRKSTKGNV